jgi:uncharacterized membrane protein
MGVRESAKMNGVSTLQQSAAGWVESGETCKGGFMAFTEKAIVVNCPITTVYNQWTQFEDFPKFMDGVLEVKQLDPKRSEWHTKIAGKEKHFETEITEQIPDRRIAWRSLSGNDNAGIVTFDRLNDRQTRVTLQMSYEPDSTLEKVGDMLGLMSHRVEKDVENFRDFIEHRGTETGGWRGTIGPQS